MPRLPPADAFYEDAPDPPDLKQMQRMGEHDPFFEAFGQREKLVDLAQSLLGQPVTPMGVEWFNKPARDGRPTPPHQDGYYFCLVPDEALTIWIALADVDPQNGCLHYRRGSHLEGIRPHGQSEVLGFSQTILDFSDKDRNEPFVGIVRRGDALVHHSATIHWAQANRCAQPRPSLAVVFRSSRAVLDDAKFDAYRNSSRQQQQALGVRPS